MMVVVVVLMVFEALVTNRTGDTGLRLPLPAVGRSAAAAAAVADAVVVRCSMWGGSVLHVERILAETMPAAARP